MKPDTTAGVRLERCDKGEHASSYDWFNIHAGHAFVGKMRCLMEGHAMTIYSIQVFPEYQGHGYGLLVVRLLKSSHDTIVADRVRPSAGLFWEKMGFSEQGDAYVWHKG
jgi:GNAT superfamily N-acetyltransferase